MTTLPLCTAFQGSRRVANGLLSEVVLAAKTAASRDPAPVLIFSDHDARVIDVDLRGDDAEVLERIADRFPAPSPSGRGRPKLGVVAREITLLPRHWDWLAQQPGGASVALRKLVEAARKADDAPALRRQAQEAAYRFMSAMAGDEPGFEEAARALFGADPAHFEAMISPWPQDVKEHARRLATPVFAQS